jgi:hypothetical protein
MWPSAYILHVRQNDQNLFKLYQLIIKVIKLLYPKAYWNNLQFSVTNITLEISKTNPSCNYPFLHKCLRNVRIKKCSFAGKEWVFIWAQSAAHLFWANACKPVANLLQNYKLRMQHPAVITDDIGYFWKHLVFHFVNFWLNITVA